MSQKKALFIHCRRGLYQLTKCKSCGHSFSCDNCDAKLVTYKTGGSSLELLCHQCQTYYKYPNHCPKCNSKEIFSKYGGIEELAQLLEKEDYKLIRLDQSKNFPTNHANEIESNIEGKNIQISFRQNKNDLVSPHLTSNLEEYDIYLHTRIFDPLLPYSIFDKIVFVQAENLLASPDYLVSEEIIKATAEILLQCNTTNEIIFDTNAPELELFEELKKLHYEYPENHKVYEWYLEFLEKEKSNRQKYGFPPFKNLLLITTQEKDIQSSNKKLETITNYLDKMRGELPEVSWSTPYPARFLKRKNMYSHHILLRFPRQYEHFNLLRKEIGEIVELYRVQVRLNPRHLF